LFTQEIYTKEETFRISSSSTLEEDHETRQESRHVMYMTPNDPRSEASTCKSSWTRRLDSKIQALTVKETTSKAHMQVHTNREWREKQPEKKPGPNRAETGLGRPAWADRPNPLRARFGAPFDLAASQAIYSPLAESHAELHSSSATEERRREGHHHGEERVEMVD
jgi:hypothetical protein